MVCTAINAKRVLPDRTTECALLERKTAVPPSKRAHTGSGRESFHPTIVAPDGFEFRCDNGKNCECSRWTAVTALHWAVTTGGFDSETVQDVMLGAVERRFGNMKLPASQLMADG